MKITLPSRVKIVEVGPRDGLQNEPEQIPTATKLGFIQGLADAGLPEVEVTSFVRPDRIPQLADALDIVKQLPQQAKTVFTALVPNMKGLERAIEAGIKRIAVFTAASESFTKKNINMTIQESLAAFEPVVKKAKEAGISVRGYVSTCFVCPYEGEIKKEQVRDVTEKLLAMGVDEVSLGDTIGKASPKDVEETVGYVLETVPREKLALHFHDTYGRALANVMKGLELGITTFDSSAGGLGGCPYAPGASGNLATEDLVSLLDRLGIETGVDIEKVAAASQIIETAVGRELPSKMLKQVKSAKSKC